MRLTILFDDPYWIGLLEVERDGLLYAARYIFGAEPSDQEVYAFVQRDLLVLQERMTVGIPVSESEQRHINPKRTQREVNRQMQQEGITSKAHEAMRLQIEANKQQRRVQSRLDRDEQRTYKREVTRAKAKAKHRGR